jgi:hypothetical protein
MIKYPIETRATTLVYFNESSLFRKLNGIRMSMNAVIQKFRSTKNGTSSALSLKPLMTPGIRSPMMIRYETPTPKHLMAMAASNNTAAFGYVICEREKNDEVPRSKYLAHLDCRYKPKPDVRPHHMIRMTPSMIPKCDIAAGITSVPAPIT